MKARFFVGLSNDRRILLMFSKYIFSSLLAVIMAASGLLSLQAYGQLESGWKTHDLDRPAPKVVTPGKGAISTTPPSDALILFDGSNFDSWRGGVEGWKIVDNAMVFVDKAGPLMTKEEFGDCQLHLEWAAPAEVKGNGQQRGNSGVFLMNAFELQVLDGYENPTNADTSAASIYGQYPPLVNASRRPGQWQSYDIIFRAPRFGDDGKLLERARMTALHNGVLVQDNSEILGPTSWLKHRQYAQGKTTGPIRIQDHGSPVRYRNIWIRRLADQRPLPKQPYPQTALKLSPEKQKRLIGTYPTGNQKEFHIFEKEGRVYCKLYGVRMRMLAVSETEFTFEKTAGKITFQLSENGEVESANLQLDGGGVRTGKKKKEASPKKVQPKSGKDKRATEKSAK